MVIVLFSGESVSHEIQLRMDAITFISFAIDLTHRKLTASVYFTIALLLPPASNCIRLYSLVFSSFFLYGFNIRYFVVLRKTRTIARTIAIGRDVFS